MINEHMKAKRLRQHAQHICISWDCRAEKMSGIKSPSLSQKQFLIDNYLQMKFQFLPKGVSLGKQPTQRQFLYPVDNKSETFLKVPVSQCHVRAFPFLNFTLLFSVLFYDIFLLISSYCTGSLCIHYWFQYSAFMGLLSMQMKQWLSVSFASSSILFHSKLFIQF